VVEVSAGRLRMPRHEKRVAEGRAKGADLHGEKIAQQSVDMAWLPEAIVDAHRSILKGGDMTSQLTTRRRFAAVGASGLAALAWGPSTAGAAAPGIETFALDPFGGDGKCAPSCAACSACVAHAANKLFATKEAADSARAHKGCNCAIVAGQTLTEGTYKQLFAAAPTADRRRSDVTTILGGTVQQHSVPMLVGAGPAVVVGSGVAATLWVVRRRMQLMSPQ
jgi:hypothetical protein